jgi:hypothetical protein
MTTFLITQFGPNSDEVSNLGDHMMRLTVSTHHLI